jgi:hypothetical protein
MFIIFMLRFLAASKPSTHRTITVRKFSFKIYDLYLQRTGCELGGVRGREYAVLLWPILVLSLQSMELGDCHFERN